MGLVDESHSDRDGAVTGHDRRDERQEALEVRGEVDVHVGDDVGVARPPRLAERPAASLFLEAHVPDRFVACGEASTDDRRVVGARVVGDRHRERERELPQQVAEQHADVLRERRRLVVARDDDLDRLPLRVHRLRAKRRGLSAAFPVAVRVLWARRAVASSRRARRGQAATARRASARRWPGIASPAMIGYPHSSSSISSGSSSEQCP